MLKHNDRNELSLKPLSSFLANYFAVRKGLDPAVQEDMLEALTGASPDLFKAVGSNPFRDVKPIGEHQRGLQDFSNMSDSTLLDQPLAAKFLGMSQAFLQASRTNGRYSIPFIKVGRKVKYRLSDLKHFLESRRITHTGEGVR